MAKPKIYIDPGHGGNDPGAVGIGGIKEKDINLAVAKYLQTELKRQGFDVMMSRTSDVTKSLKERTSEANKWGADIVVSNHSNAHPRNIIHGTETYVYKYGFKSEMLANNVQINLVSTLGTKNRGVKEGNFAMVRDTVAPAILVELGFISNEEDCAKLMTATYQKECAVAICKGICKYFGVTYKGETTMTNKTKFNDEDKMSSWAVESIKRATELKIMSGVGNSKFDPKGNLTREQAAVMVMNLYDAIAKLLDK